MLLKRLFIHVILVLWSPVLATAGSDLEYKVQTAFLFQFTKFIEWKDTRKPAASGGFVIGVLGDSPIVGHLKELAEKKTAKGNKIEVRIVSMKDDLAELHILFIPPNKSSHAKEVVARVKGAPILTVGDGPGLAEQGVVINFFKDGENLKFEINRTAAETQNLSISSQLLKLAKIQE